MWLALLPAAWALPALQLPPTEDPAAWSDAAEIAGLVPGASPDEGAVTIVTDTAGWRVEATRGDERRAAPIAPPLTPAAREDALLLGRSLLRSLEVPEPVGWGWIVEAAPVYLAPRSFGDQGVGALIGAEARRGSLGIEASVRGAAPRTLHDADAAQWWLPVDGRAGVGWRSEGTTRLMVGGEAGLSARVYGEDGEAVQLDWKPLAGASAGVEADIAERWSLRARVGLDVDLGRTRIEGRGDPYELGLVELGVALGVAWRIR